MVVVHHSKKIIVSPEGRSQGQRSRVCAQTGPIRFSLVGLKFGWGGQRKIRKGGTRPGVWCEPRRAGRGGQSCAFEAPGMTHGDVDMPDVHVDSRAVDRRTSRCQWTMRSTPLHRSEVHQAKFMCSLLLSNQLETPQATAAARPIPAWLEALSGGAQVCHQACRL